MGSLCSCLCVQAGHTGQCQEIAESGLYLPAEEPRIRPIGVVCRPCYEAVAERNTGTRGMARARTEPGRQLASARP